MFNDTDKSYVPADYIKPKANELDIYEMAKFVELVSRNYAHEELKTLSNTLKTYAKKKQYFRR